MSLDLGEIELSYTGDVAKAPGEVSGAHWRPGKDTQWVAASRRQ
ncbi:hypothetical protein [Cupriavidus necator]|nr:hypothetical protein [Cupriavidus necator]